MRRSKTLEKLQSGKTVRICAMGHYIPAYVHQAARAGFDAIWLDLEHRLIDDREVQALLAHFHMADIDCLLRPPTIQKTRLYRYLEEGASSLLIPHVSTPEKARLLVEATKFPPLGDRGLDGMGLDNVYEFPEMPAYTEAANRETLLFVQIETPEAVENAEAIAAVDGVDGVFVGIGDLGFRLKCANSALTLDDAIEKVAQAASKHGKPWGLPTPSLEAMKKYRAMGAQLLAQGSEFRALLDMLAETAKNFDAIEDA